MHPYLGRQEAEGGPSDERILWSALEPPAVMEKTSMCQGGGSFPHGTKCTDSKSAIYKTFIYTYKNVTQLTREYKKTIYIKYIRMVARRGSGTWKWD